MNKTNFINQSFQSLKKPRNGEIHWINKSMFSEPNFISFNTDLRANFSMKPSSMYYLMKIKITFITKKYNRTKKCWRQVDYSQS